MTETAQEIIDIDDGESEVDSQNVDYFSDYNKNNQSSCDDHSESESKSDFSEDVFQSDRFHPNQNADTQQHLISPLDTFDNHFNDDILFDETQSKSWNHFYDHYCQDVKKFPLKEIKSLENNDDIPETLSQLRHSDDLPDKSKIKELYSPLNELTKECFFDNRSDDINQPEEESTREQNFLERVHLQSSKYLNETLYDTELLCHYSKLKILLDKDFEIYKQVMQKWFEGELDRDTYERYIKENLPKESLKYHNKLILTLLQKSFNLSTHINEPRHFTDQIDINAFFTEFEKSRGPSFMKKIESTSALGSISLSAAKDESQDDDDDIVIKKNKKGKRKRFQILDDDDDDEYDIPTTSANVDSGNNELFNPLKKKKRKMVITSDDEGEGESSCPSVLDAESSSSNMILEEDDTKVIDIKSSGMLKTTLTISRKSLLDSPASKPSNTSAKGSSLLDRLLSSETPISLLPNSDVTSEIYSHKASQSSTNSLDKISSLNDKKVIRIQNSTLLKPTTTSSDMKITKVASLKTATPQTQKIVATLNPSNLRISTTITKPASKQNSSSSLIQGNSKKGENKKLKSALLNNSPMAMSPNTTNTSIISNANQSDVGTLFDDNSKRPAQVLTSQNTPLLVKKLNEGKSTSSTVNSKLIELLNRKSSNVLDNPNALSSQQNKQSPLKTLLSSTIAADDGHISSKKFPDQINGNKHHNKNRPKSKKSTANKKRRKSESANSINGEHLSETSSQQSSLVFNGTFATQENLGSFLNNDTLIEESHPPQSGFFIDYNIDPLKNTENLEDDSSETNTKPFTEQEMSTCAKELSLPDNDQLIVRIANYASHYQLTSFDNKIVILCQIALKNFMKNILSQLLVSRASFRVNDDGIKHHIGVPVGNPYVNTCHRPFRMELNPNGSMFSSCNSLVRLAQRESQLLPTSYLDSHVELKKFNAKKKQLIFGMHDQATIDPNQEMVISKFRPNSGILHIPEESPRMTLRSNLHHLYSILNSDRSLIPVNRVLSRALNETVAAFNNVREVHSEGNS